MKNATFVNVHSGRLRPNLRCKRKVLCGLEGVLETVGLEMMSGLVHTRMARRRAFWIVEAVCVCVCRCVFWLSFYLRLYCVCVGILLNLVRYIPWYDDWYGNCILLMRCTCASVTIVVVVTCRLEYAQSANLRHFRGELLSASGRNAF